MTNDSDHIVTESAARIFADLADPQTINRLDNGAWKAPFWQALCDAGLPLAWVPERLGGAGATLAEGFAVLGVAGRFALAVPLAETLLAGWLLTRAGVAAPNGSMTIAPSRPSDRHAERFRNRDSIRFRGATHSCLGARQENCRCAGRCKRLHDW